MRFKCVLVGVTISILGIWQISTSCAQVKNQKQESAGQSVGPGSGSTSIRSRKQLDSTTADVDLREWYRKIIATAKQQIFHDGENTVAPNQVCFVTLTFTRAGEITVNFVPRLVAEANGSLATNEVFVQKLKNYGVALNSEILNTDNSQLEKAVVKAFDNLRKSAIVRFPDGAKQDVYQFEAFFLSHDKDE